jgi:prolyl oligopeptidase
VGPQHARKFAARLSEFGVPYLYYEVTEGRHDDGANLKERAHTLALEFTYFSRKSMDLPSRPSRHPPGATGRCPWDPARG